MHGGKSADFCCSLTSWDVTFEHLQEMVKREEKSDVCRSPITVAVEVVVTTMETVVLGLVGLIRVKQGVGPSIHFIAGSTGTGQNFSSMIPSFRM